MRIVLHPADAVAALDRIDAATASIAGRRSTLDTEMATLAGSWEGTSQAAHAATHRDWSKRLDEKLDDSDAAVASARERVQSLVRAEEQATAVWL